MPHLGDHLMMLVGDLTQELESEREEQNLTERTHEGSTVEEMVNFTTIAELLQNNQDYSIGSDCPGRISSLYDQHGGSFSTW